METIPNKQQKLSTLRSSLPHGSLKLISERTGCHRDTVARVLAGKSYREDIIKEALKIIEDFKDIMDKIERIRQELKDHH